MKRSAENSILPITLALFVAQAGESFQQVPHTTANISFLLSFVPTFQMKEIGSG
jgi:hypothetical protein